MKRQTIFPLIVLTVAASLLSSVLTSASNGGWFSTPRVLLKRTAVQHSANNTAHSERLVSKQDITVVVTTAPSPLNPKTCILEDTMKSIPVGYPILIVFDSCGAAAQEQNCTRYEEYKTNVAVAYRDQPDVDLVFVPQNASGKALTRSIRHALTLIPTQFVVAVQHDLGFVKNNAASTINFASIASDMLVMSNLTYVSFNFHSNNSPATDASITGHPEVIGIEQPSLHGNHSYMTTSVWTDNNFVCRADYLRGIVDECVAPFPEWCMMNAIRIGKTMTNAPRPNWNYTWEEFGTWRYGHQGLEKQLFHLDGRRAVACRNNSVDAGDSLQRRRLTQS